MGISGDLRIDTQRLSIKDGANIEANNVSLFGDGNSNLISQTSTGNNGNLIINASESIEIAGFTVAEKALFNNLDNPNSHISSTTNTSNPASDVTINTGKLLLRDRGEINVSGLGTGAAGRLAIDADSVSLKREGSLNGLTNSGQGGDIQLRVTDLLSLSDRSAINTSAISLGNGGNINIAADFAIASGNSSVSANAADIGTGGNIKIEANDVFLTGNSSITADSALGIDGTVKIETQVNNDRSNYTKLSQQLLQTDSQIAQSCGTNDDSQGVFSYTGRGGLPINPLTDFQTENVIPDFSLVEDFVTRGQHKTGSKTLDLLKPEVIEVNGWQTNGKGKIELIALNNKDDRSTIPHFDSNRCPLSSYK